MYACVWSIKRWPAISCMSRRAAAGLVHEPCRVGNERASPGVRRAAAQAEIAVEPSEPVDMLPSRMPCVPPRSEGMTVPTIPYGSSRRAAHGSGFVRPLRFGDAVRQFRCVRRDRHRHRAPCPGQVRDFACAQAGFDG